MRNVRHPILLVILGSVTFLLLHLHFITSWELLYAEAPWPALEKLARDGLVDAWFGHSPRSLQVTQLVLGGLALVVGFMDTGRSWKAPALLWLGVMLPLVPMIILRMFVAETGILTFEPVTDRPMWEMAVLLEAGRTLVPLVAGWLAARLLVKTKRMVFG